MILVDYRCDTCGRHEAVVPRPIPASRACPRCGAPARRIFSSAGLTGRAPRPGEVAARSRKADALVPGLCAAPPEARTAVISRYLGDDDTYAREVSRQTERFERQGATRATPGHAHGPARADHGEG